MKCPKCGSLNIVMSVYPYMGFGVDCQDCKYEFNNDEKIEYEYQSRLDKVLSKFNLTYQGCGDLYCKVNDLIISYENNRFDLGYDYKDKFYTISYNHSLETVESLLDDLSDKKVPVDFWDKFDKNGKHLIVEGEE